MPLCATALRRPYLFSTGHTSGGASSTLWQPRRTAVSQMRSMFHCHSVALRHQYASDCLMRPFVITRLLLTQINAIGGRKRLPHQDRSDAAEFGHGFLHGLELLDERHHGVLGVVEFFGLLEHI